MKKNHFDDFTSGTLEAIMVKAHPMKTTHFAMASRVCANCGHTKDVAGGKECSNGHFVCHSCCKHHVHCPLCRKTLR